MSESFKKIEPNEDPRDNLEGKVVSSYEFIDTVFRMLEMYVGYFFATFVALLGVDLDDNEESDNENKPTG